LALSSPPWLYSSWNLQFRLYTHALLLESQIFPNVELCDESPDFTPFGFTDIWKGIYHGELVCIKVIRAQHLACQERIKRVCGYFIYQMCTECGLYQTFHQEINGHKCISHPNVLPIIEVSETLVPFYIMSPWMSEGNITQYTQMNPDADRLMLVCAHQL
jgi:uncharacterized protein Usg